MWKLRPAYAPPHSLIRAFAGISKDCHFPVSSSGCAGWSVSEVHAHVSCSITEPTKWYVHPAKSQISLGIRTVWSEFSLCAQWVAKDPSFLHADSEDSDQTGRMPRLIWVFTGRKGHLVGFVMRQPMWFCRLCCSQFKCKNLQLTAHLKYEIQEQLVCEQIYFPL